jgi:mRNA interferase RelE/StbE
MIYKVIIPKNVVKIFEKLDNNIKTKVKEKLILLKDNPNPTGSLKLKGFTNQYRIRIGDYRIRYLIIYEQFEVLILDIAHRKDIYKN